ncbi:MAG: DUF885 domain-containing protein [Candidatus Eisenbacteria bacterium]|nr:DUF885 domain-containing protein [Candidatus Eisenbacteria bacterium]
MEGEQSLRALSDEYFDFYVESYPEMATVVGLHTFDDRLTRYDRASIDKQVRAFRGFKRRAEELLSAGGLSTTASIDARLIASNCEIQVLEIEKMMKPWVDPTLYIEMSLYGLFLLVSREVVPVEKRANSVAGRLREFARVLVEAKQNLENPPSIFTRTALGMLKGADAFVKETVRHFGDSLAGARSELESSSTICIEAMRDFETYLENDLLPRSNGDFAIGRDLFETKLRVQHMLDVDTKTLEKMGRALLLETKEQIEHLSNELHPGKNWRDVIEALKEHHPDASMLRSEYEEHMRKAREFVLAKDLVPIPAGEELTVIDTPSFERGTIPYAAYVSPGPFDEKQEGLFFVTPVDTSAPIEVQREQLKGHSYASMVLTALHEGYPGHHLQFIHSNRVPTKLRHLCGNTVFAEGWALYCEELMKEAGFYRSREVELFQLKDMLWRAARVVVDVGLHTKSMSFDEAVEFLISEALIERPNAVAEVRRYTNSPSQPSSYAVGKAEVLALRDGEKQRLGPNFNLSRFHEKLLSSGTIPFKLVKEELGAKDESSREK